MSVLSIDSLSLKRNGRLILKDISFCLDRGQCLFVLGPNGAGKTSLIRSIAGLIQETKSFISIEGKKLSSLKSQREIAQKIAYVPQNPDLALPYRVAEFLLFSKFPSLLAPSLASIQESSRVEIQHAISICGIESIADQKLNSLSGGEKQKVLIAACLVQGAGVLLLDEPTSHLDPFWRDEVLKILETIRREKSKTLIMVSHEAASLAHFSEVQILAIREGQMVFSGTREVFMTQAWLDRLYRPTTPSMTEHPSLDMLKNHES